MTTRSALFVDFDNFFSGLVQSDPLAALDVVERPSIWVNGLREAGAPSGGRRWLILRCYMNPSGWVPYPGRPDDRLFFSRLRPFFVQAGFEVVDCPTLTRGTKNGADIRIAVDVMTALRATTRFDEIVVASSDADFTPLLQVVRAEDRRITMIATGATAVAYQALADEYLDEQDVLDLMREPEAEGSPVPESDAGPTPADTRSPAASWEEFAAAVSGEYAAATTPINLSRLLSGLIETLGRSISDGGWFGNGAFTKAIEQIGLPGLRMSQHYLWDETRHEAPAAADAAREVAIPAIASQVCELVQLPRLTGEQWTVVFRSLESYASLHEFTLTESTRWSRDHAAAQGVPVPRPAFGYVVRGCLAGGAPLNADPPPTAADLGRALLGSVVERATRAGLEISEADERVLADWMRLAELDDG